MTTTAAAAPTAPETPRSPVSQALPHWDMTPVFPSLESPEFTTAFDRFPAAIGELRALCDERDVRKPAEATLASSRANGRSGDKASGGATDALASGLTQTFEEVTGRLNALWEDLRLLDAYVSAFVTTDSRNDAAQAKLSELQTQSVELQKLGTRYEAWIGSLDPSAGSGQAVEGLITRSDVAREHAFALRKLAESARHLMSEAEEDLAASLYPSGGMAWGKLHSNVSSQLMVTVHFPAGSEDGKARTEHLPMSAVRGLAHDPDPAVRKAAYEAELKGWETVAVPLAAAINGIKGEAHTLAERRKWADPLDPVLFSNNIDRVTLDAMHEACGESFPDFRRYLKAKARLLGQTSLPWYDMFAPVGGSEGSRVWEFGEAADFVVSQFGTYANRLSGLAQRAIAERWIDAEPRDGKVDGAFCMGVRRDESRVLMNYEPSFNSVQTMAHELGHAYHNVNLAPRTALQRETPMALAETASIFCETLVVNAALERASGAEKLALLEGHLQGSCQVVVDIHSRFLFESRVFAQRAKRELSVTELNELMLGAQKETYGDGLDQEALHQFMWAMKPHYYMANFYNWPYTFGLLFGLGLYARYQEDAEPFRAGYDDLLASTGAANAADLGQRFGIDIRSAGFWRASLDLIRHQITEFERLVNAQAKG